MINIPYEGFLLFLAGLFLLVTVQQLLHREIQANFLLITRKPSLAIGLFSLTLFPGVFVHEFSHWLMAILLGVKIRRVSLLPTPLKGGKLRLGYVETKSTDFFRDSLIGLAPFITGCLITSYIGIYRLDLFALVEAVLNTNGERFFTQFFALPQQTDFGIWLYLAFAVSSTMLPSQSDRESWGGIGLALAGLLVIVLVAGLGEWMATQVAPVLNRWMLTLSIVLISSFFVHIVLLIPAWLIRLLLSRLMGLRVTI